MNGLSMVLLSVAYEGVCRVFPSNPVVKGSRATSVVKITIEWWLRHKIGLLEGSWGAGRVPWGDGRRSGMSRPG